MEKEKLFQRVQSMIMSSSKKPKYMSISTVKVADILDLKHDEVERGLQQLVNEGSLRKSKMTEPPYNDVYLLP